MTGGTNTERLPLLLIPGIGCDAASWKTIAGQVMSSTAGSVEAMALDILDRAPSRFALAGHSMGSYVAMAIARLAPDRIERLALLSPIAVPDLPAAREARLALIAEAERDYAAIMERFPMIMIHRDRRSDEALIDELRTMLERVGRATFVRQLRAALDRPDARPGLSAIAIPTLVVTGDGDRVVPSIHAMEIADTIPRAELVMISGCGHMPMLESVKETRAAMRRWLDC
jgi:pimeloyl-ACP methyl ester carboxylesterase